MSNSKPISFHTASAEMVILSATGDRAINQDRADVFSFNDVITLALADGMGGHPRGEVAAEIFINCTRLLLRKYAKGTFSAEKFMPDLMQMAHQKILEYGRKQFPRVDPRTTCVIVSVYDNHMQWSHLGDSRTYLFRHDRAHLRTLDHTQVEMQRLKGELENDDSQSVASGRSGVTRCLGSTRDPENIRVTPPSSLKKNDIVLLCTDGIWSQLQQQQLEAIMLQPDKDLPSVITDLVETAVAAGKGRSDNATALAMRWLADDKTDTVQPTVDSDDLQAAVEQLQTLIDKYN